MIQPTEIQLKSIKCLNAEQVNTLLPEPVMTRLTGVYIIYQASMS